MSENKHYKFRDQIMMMDEMRLNIEFDSLEAKLRSNEFAYSEVPKITQKQLADIQKSWPLDLFTAFKEKAKEKIAQVNGTKLTPTIAYQAMLEILNTTVLQRRLTNTATATPIEVVQRRIITDIAVSMILDCAPDATENKESVRTVDGKKIDIRTLIRSNRLVVNCEEAVADIFIFCFYNIQLKKTLLIGWSKQQDIRQGQRGNKMTDPANCTWKTMSYWLELNALRPISSLAREFGVKEFNKGMILERVPEVAELPIPSEKLDIGFAINQQAGQDFYKVLGMEEPTLTNSTQIDTSKDETIDF